MSQRQFLPFNEDSLDSEREFDLSTMSALDYLKQVRFERKTIPQVVTVHPLRVSEPQPSENQENKDEKWHREDPTAEWSEIQKQKFEDMQHRVIELRKDPSLAGKLQSTEQLSDENTCIPFCEANEPKLSFILSINQGELEELIELLSNHLSECVELPEFYQQIPNFHWITKWIYAALACLRSPLDPEVHNTLRMIAKTCTQIRNCLKSQPPTATSEPFLPWNLIIVVIALNFRQFDLLSL